MKHNKKVTTILLLLFLIIQFFSIIVINQYHKPDTNLNEEKLFIKNGNLSNILSLFTTFIVIIFLISFILKYKIDFIMKIWFLLVIIISCIISINSIFIKNNLLFTSILSLLVAIFLGIKKVFSPSKYLNYITDILIYPGISIIFIYTIFKQNNPIQNLITIFVILILISVYDIWAVNKSKIMTKMAKYQIEKLNIFGGILVPIISKKDRIRIKKMKSISKNKKEFEKMILKSKIKISAAALGGGDIAFTTITIGIMMYSFPNQSLFGIVGLIPGLFTLLGSTLGLLYLFIFGNPKKIYPAMPYITTGIILSTILWIILI